jgi:hypothetical protein
MYVYVNCGHCLYISLVVGRKLEEQAEQRNEMASLVQSNWYLLLSRAVPAVC